MRRYFITYVDILGFEKRARKDTEKTTIGSEEVREVYRERIENRLKELSVVGTQKEYPKKERNIAFHVEQVTLDSWLLFTNDIWNAFKSIGKVLEAGLPMEIVIGIRKFKESQSRQELIVLRDETIDYLKSDISNSYRKMVGKNIEQTFVLVSKKAYESIDFSNISHGKLYKSSKGEQFYLIEKNQFERILTSLKFLEKLGSKRPEYREIDTLYTKPKNYEDIIKTLKIHNIVFIVGDAGMGKTYTAIKLLSDYYKEGYEPIYIREEQRELQWTFIKERQELEGKAVYLEDPWDKVEFKSTGGLFRDVGKLIREVKGCNCKVIISSREKVFREFIKRKETVEDTYLYAHILSLGSTYTKKKLIHMLRKYIDVFKPMWSENVLLKGIAIEFAQQNLNTPMSVKQFVENTMDAKNKENLLTGGEKAAEETRISFAREIEEMFRKGLYDYLVFLSFPCMGGMNVEIAGLCYWKVLNELKKLGYDLIRAKEFDALIEEFSNVVEIHTESNWLRYIHPLYKDAFGSTLVYEGKPTDISKKIFFKVFAKLSENDQFSKHISWNISNYFNKLPEKGRDKLLVKLSEKDHSGVAWTIITHFSKVSKELQNLLLELSEKNDAAIQIGLAIVHNFDQLPIVLRNKFLSKFVERNQATEILAKGIRDNFGGLPEEVRNKLLVKLAEKDQAASSVAVVVLEEFEKLPEKIRNELLLRLSLKEQAVRNVARAVADHFDLLPEVLRNELLLKLSKKVKPAWPIVRAIANHFNELPKNVRDLLDDLQEPLKFEIQSLARWSPLQAIRVISNVRSKIDPNFALKVLDKLSQSEDEKIRTNAKILMNSIWSDL